MAQCPICSTLAQRLGKHWHCLECNRFFTIKRKRKPAARVRRRR